MPDIQIGNPAGVYGQTATASGALVYDMVNASAGTRTAGDVVVLSGVAGTSATTTTSANDKLVCGVVGQASQGALGAALDGSTYVVGAIMPVIVRGPARINIASNTVVAADLLTTSTSAGVAATNAGAPAANAVTGSIVAVALEATAAKDASSTIRCWVMKS